jgi:hypothetical protein
VGNIQRRGEKAMEREMPRSRRVSSGQM